MASISPTPANPTGDEEDRRLSYLKASAFLSHEEVLRRRSRRVKFLLEHYRSQYWALAEEIRAKHRKYYWDYGVSPLESEASSETGNNLGEGLGESEGKKRIGSRSKCRVGGCKLRAMPFTKFCHVHILADPKQTLYKGCTFVNKSSGQNIPCGKPILRSAVASLCPAHCQKVQKHLSVSLKKAGINLCSSRRPTTQFNTILIKCIREIQERRKTSLSNASTVLNSNGDCKIDEEKIVD